MALFNKKEKKQRLELLKRNVSVCKETLKEINELYDDLKSEYEEIENTSTAFAEFAARIESNLTPEQAKQMDYFVAKFYRFDKYAGTAVRDVRDLMRNQKKRVKEAQAEL